MLCDWHFFRSTFHSVLVKSNCDMQIIIFRAMFLFISIFWLGMYIWDLMVGGYIL